MQEKQTMLVDGSSTNRPGRSNVGIDAGLTQGRPGAIAATPWKRLSGIAAVLLSALLVHPLPAAASETPVMREELQFDLKEAFGLLGMFHPNLTVHTSRKDLEALHQRLRESVGERTSKEEAYLVLAELVGAVCDEHTWIQQGTDIETDWPQGWPWYDYPLIVDDSRLFVENPDTGLKDEVLSIDDVDGARIAASLAAGSGSNGCLGGDILLVNEALSVYGNIVAAMIGVSGRYVLKTRPAGTGGVWTQVVEGADRYATAIESLRVLGRQTRQFEAAMTDGGFRPQRLGSALRLAGLDYRFSPDLNLAYLGIDEFRDSALAEEGIDLAMRDIIARNPDGLIIDLVDNPGGSVNTVQMMLAYLLPRSHRVFSRAHVRDVSKKRPPNFEYFDEDAEEARSHDVGLFSKIKRRAGKRSARVAKRSFGKPDYKGKILVMVSPASRSGSTIMAANLRRLRKATIVGSMSATDTVTHCSRAHGTFTLQYTGFLLHIPELCYQSPENRFSDDHALVPDIEVGPMDATLVDLHAMILGAALEEHDKSLTH